MTTAIPETAPLIEVIIPVHTSARPIERAVGSVLAADSAHIQMTVVCHGVEPTLIAGKLGEIATDPRVRLIPLDDGVPSPAGPLNEGVRVSTGAYLTFLGSDDAFMPGVLDTWETELAESPDILIGQLLTETAGRVLAPSPRVGRFQGLSAVRDLLNYRSAPVGALFARHLFASEGAPRFLEGARTGEDLGLGLILWNTARSIHYSRCAEGYYGYESGDDRVTHTPLPPREVQRPIRAAVRLPVLQELPKRSRQAVAVKLLRHQILSWVQAVDRQGGLDTDTMAEAAESVALLRGFAPGALGFFHRFDSAALRAIEREDVAGFRAQMQQGNATAFRWKALPSNPFRVFSPENAVIRIRRTQAIPATLVHSSQQKD